MRSRILYTSFPRTGTVWTEKVLTEYLDSIDFNYSIVSHHGMWTNYPMRLESPIIEETIAATEICFHKRRRDHKRTFFSNLETLKIACKNYSTPKVVDAVDILTNIFGVYVDYYRKWNKYIDTYPRARFIYHEDMLEQKEDYLSPILKASDIEIDKYKLKKSFDKHSTKKTVSKIHIERQGTSIGNHLIQYLEPDYEKRYEKFLNEWGDIIDNKLKRSEIAN